MYKIINFKKIIKYKLIKHFFSIPFYIIFSLFGVINITIAGNINSNTSDTLNTELNTSQKESLKNNFFIPVIGLYKKIVVDKQISDLIGQISISLSDGNKIPLGDEIDQIKNYLFSYIPDNNKQLANNIWNKSNYIRSWLIAGISTREYGWARVNNPKNGYGNFQITAPNVCGQIIIPNSIVANLGRKIYFTPPSLCEGVYKLCTYKNKENYTCTCGNMDYWALQAKLLDGRNGFNAIQWISMYKNFCIGKDKDTNVFNNLRYPFQYGDFIGFVYNKINGYKNGIYIAYNMKNGLSTRSRKIMSLSDIIKRVYNVDLSNIINATIDGYIAYLNKNRLALDDLSDPRIDFDVTIGDTKTTYQKVLIYIANKINTSPDVVANLFNSYQMAIVFSKYNGLGNVGKNFFDNSYVSNLTDGGSKKLGIKTYYIFGKITKDYCTSCIGKDMQPYGAMIYANIYNKKDIFLQYLLLQLFPDMIQKNLFSKLVDYLLY